jgi:hypothetical protein
VRERLVTWLVILLLVVLAAYGWSRASTEGERADGLALELKASKERTGRIQTAVLAVERERDKAQGELRKALAGSKEWADTAAPAPVADELCKRLKCR